jgi:hypothetical protein
MIVLDHMLLYYILILYLLFELYYYVNYRLLLTKYSKHTIVSNHSRKHILNKLIWDKENTVAHIEYSYNKNINDITKNEVFQFVGNYI